MIVNKLVRFDPKGKFEKLDFSEPLSKIKIIEPVFGYIDSSVELLRGVDDIAFKVWGFDGNFLQMDILDTPKGFILQTLIRNGVELRFTSGPLLSTISGKVEKILHFVAEAKLQ
mgnify:CR=1 FL=1